MLVLLNLDGCGTYSCLCSRRGLGDLFLCRNSRGTKTGTHRDSSLSWFRQFKDSVPLPFY